MLLKQNVCMGLLWFATQHTCTHICTHSHTHIFEHVHTHTHACTAFVTVYLVDSVTGGVVHHTTHKQAAGPVFLVHSENWIVVRLAETS